MISSAKTKRRKAAKAKARPKRKPRNTAQTKARILAAAQTAFVEKGYSQANLRSIAEHAGVATSLVIKHFGSKKNLFAEALTKTLEDAEVAPEDRSHFGERLVRLLIDPRIQVLTPAMIALSLEDEEARLVAAKVARDHMIVPTAAWIGPPQAEARAANLLMLSIGFALFQRHLKAEISREAREVSAKWFARLIQAVIDHPPGSDDM